MKNKRIRLIVNLHYTSEKYLNDCFYSIFNNKFILVVSVNILIYISTLDKDNLSKNKFGFKLM